MIELDIDISKYEILRNKGKNDRSSYIMLPCDNCNELHRVAMWLFKNC